MDTYQTNLGLPLGICKILMEFGDRDRSFKVIVRRINTNLSRRLTIVDRVCPEYV